MVDPSQPAGAALPPASTSAADALPALPAGVVPGTPDVSPSGAPGGSCANTGLTPRPANLSLVSAAVLCLINQQRVLGGLTPLRASARLAGAAQRHSNDMAGTRQFDHQGSAGDSPLDRIRATSYLEAGRAFTLGENIAWQVARRSTASAMVAGWMASPDHRANIMSADFRDTGIGLAPAPPTAFTGGVPGMTVTEDFAALT